MQQKQFYKKSSIAVDSAGTQNQTVIQDITATNTASEQGSNTWKIYNDIHNNRGRVDAQ